MRSRLALLVLVPAGVLASHGLAYQLVAHHHEAGLHHYLAPVAAVAGPLTLLGWVWVVTRATATPLPSPARVAVWQLGGFLAMETAERLVAGEGVLGLADAPVIVGLLLQAIVAAVLVATTRVARAALTRPRRSRARVQRGHWPVLDQWCPPGVLHRRAPARAPPLLLGPG